MYKIGVSALLFGLAFDAAATVPQPELTLTPLNEQHLAMPKGEVGTVQYLLANQGSKAYSLVMKPMAGIAQQLDQQGYCQDTIYLEPGQSCTLSLLINANETIGGKKQGPVLCEDARDWDNNKQQNGLCVQPKEEEQISVRELSSGQASFSVQIKRPLKLKHGQALEGLKRCFASAASCTLVMFQGSDVIGHLRITNNSTTTTIYNLQAYNLPATIGQDASDCAIIPPRGTCDLVFTAGNTRYANVPVAVYGNNTPTLSVTLQVLGIGDPFNGNPLYQLPTNANLNYYTSAQADSPLNNRANAEAACTGDSELPSLNGLSRLYSASNCNGGPIGGFSCINPSYYWSTSTTRVINFANGTQTTIFPDTNHSRCVEGYVLVDA